MRPMIFVLLLTALLSSCSDDTTGPTPETEPGKLVVYIYWDLDRGSSGKRVEIVETGVASVTDSSGVVEFALEPGVYTVRAYDIGRPGVSPPSVDASATVRSTETSRVEFFDCTECVEP